MTKKKEKKFIDLILDQREQKEDSKFEGTFLSYLNEVNKDPSIAKSSHKRLYEVIIDHGVDNIAESDPRKYRLFGGDNVRVYDYFKNHFFGMERVIERLMNFLRSASLKGEES